MTVTASNLSLFSTLAIELNPPDLDPEVAAKQGPRSYTLTAETLLNPTVPNMAVVRVDVLDPDGNSTSTTAVLNIVASTNSAPSITNTSASYQEQLSSESSAVHAFTVSDSNLSGDQLKVSAFSSNTDLVPNDLANNIIVTQPGTDGSGTVWPDPRKVDMTKW